jgi:sugar lactone lactonase YvrE
MCPGLRILIIAAFLLGGLSAPAPHGLAANQDTLADRVLGQANFTDHASNQGNAAPGQATLKLAQAMALDASGNLYVSDTNNHRILGFNAPLTNGRSAAMVIGQGLFITGAINHGSLTPQVDSLYLPTGLTLDAQGNLYVSDIDNNRVLEYDLSVRVMLPIVVR